MPVQQIGCNDDDGLNIGKAATNLVAFHGSTPCDQAAVITSVSTSAAVSGAFGFTTTQAAALLTAVNAIITALKEKGLVASS